jgi:hypothetical protein
LCFYVRADEEAGERRRRNEQPFLKHLRSVERGLRVLYLETRNGQGFADAEDGITLQTPFSLDELQEAVADLLSRHT